MKGYIHQLESFGCADGPGSRFIIFFAGCPLRCLYCHNPDTWTFDGAQEFSVDEIVSKALKYKGYFGSKGGITCTGGEPLVQIDFLIELFKKFKENNIHTLISGVSSCGGDTMTLLVASVSLIYSSNNMVIFLAVMLVA